MKKSYLDESSAAQDFHGLKDEDILKRSQREPAFFELLVERYRAPLTRAALRVIKNPEEAEDIVQEAFVKIYKNAHRFQKLDGIEFKSWAYKVAINTAITHYRKIRRGEFLSEDPSIFEKPSSEQFDARLHERADSKALIAETLEKVPEHLRTVLEAYYFEDKSYQTIAAEHNISIPTLKMRLFRAKRIFKKLNPE